MKIIKLEAANVKRLKAVSIQADGKPVVIVGGKNEAGKSSVLDSIQYALGGKGTLPEQPIRQGQDTASIVCDLGELVVKRVITANGQSSLIVQSKDGLPYKSPQTLLDSLCAHLTFDPLSFCRLEPAKQAEMLRRLVGLDFSELDAQRAKLYDERTMVGRDGRAAQTELTKAPFHANAPEEEVNLSDLVSKLEAARKINAENTMARRVFTDDQARLTCAINKRDHIQRQIEELTRDLAYQNAEIEKQTQEVNRKAEMHKTMIDVDESSITKAMKDLQSVNEQVRQNKGYLKLNASVEAARERYRTLTDQIAAIDAKKSATLAKAQFPLEGLSFNESGVTFNNIPFAQCSRAQQIKVAVAIGLAFNPKLRVILIRDGSLLDQDNLAMIAQVAAEKDAQVWIERVGEGAEASVIIEDGSVKPPTG